MTQAGDSNDGGDARGDGEAIAGDEFAGGDFLLSLPCCFFFLIDLAGRPLFLLSVC